MIVEARIEQSFVAEKMAMAKGASPVIQMTTTADYEAAYFEMNLVMAQLKIPLMKLLKGHALENSEKPKTKIKT